MLGLGVLLLVTAHVSAIDVLSYLGSNFVNSLEETPAELPLPLIPSDVTEEAIGGLGNLQRSFSERDALDDGDSIDQAATVQYNLLRLQAAQQLAAVLDKHAAVNMALACFDREAKAAARRSEIAKQVNASLTRAAARDITRKTETLDFEAARARNDRTRRKLAEVTALIKEQRTANYSKLHLNSLFDGVLATMYGKLARSQSLVETSTKRHDEWVNALITSHGNITTALHCSECMTTQAVLKKQRNATQLELLGSDMCPTVTSSVEKDKKYVSSIVNGREEVWAASERVFRTIDQHRASLREQNTRTISDMRNISKEVFGRN